MDKPRNGAPKDSRPVSAGVSAAESATVRLVVTEPVRHDGRDYAPGAHLELPAGEAAALAALGVAEAADPAAATD